MTLLSKASNVLETLMCDFGRKEQGKKGMDISPSHNLLSLKRLVPMAEEAKIITDDTLLTPEELSEFKQLHNKILIVQTPISSATTITSKISNL